MQKTLALVSIFCMLMFCPNSVTGEESMGQGLLVSVIQEPWILSSREGIAKLVSFAKSSNTKILYVQIYRANQAWFPTEFADTTPYKICFANISEDPFELLIKEAHASGIKVFAWLNLLTLSTNQDAPILKKFGTGILTRNLQEKRTLEDYKIDDQYFIEPGNLQARTYLSNLLEGMLRRYTDLDGVLFDYIRYPDKNPAYGYTTENVERFKKAANVTIIDEDSQIWKDWKRTQVTEFVALLAKKTRDIRPDIHVAATGCMPYTRAYHEAFQDWPGWLKKGIVDSITVMSYSPDPSEFERWLLKAKDLTGELFKKVNIGVGAYKLLGSPALFEQEFTYAEEASGGAPVIFHYGSLLENPVLADFLIRTNKKG